MTSDISRKLKELRRQKRLNQLEVSEATGLSRSTISNYEVGRREISLKNLNVLASYYGVSLDYFGISPQDEVFDLLARAKNVFENESISTNQKDELYKELMKFYLHISK